jgi:hypothetical protein
LVMCASPMTGKWLNPIVTVTCFGLPVAVLGSVYLAVNEEPRQEYGRWTYKPLAIAGCIGWKVA